MFTERLNTLMAALEISSSTLAKHMGCDRSNIDRFRKSIRVPQRDGKSALRIVEALYTYADDEGKTDVLLQTVPCADASSGEKIREAMMMWLFEGEKEKNAATKPAERQQKNSVFGQKLNAVMELIGLSNSRLGKLLHVDPSYISRFRSGLRSPVANPRMADKLCWILLEITAEQNKLPQLAALMQVPGTVIEVEDPALPPPRRSSPKPSPFTSGRRGCGGPCCASSAAWCGRNRKSSCFIPIRIWTGWWQTPFSARSGRP